MKKNYKESAQSLFQPTFGNCLEQYIGRDVVIGQFMAGLKELGRKGPAIHPYRKRLVEAPRRGELVFAVPYLAEYLLG